jgi:1-deoxy-D-xylulose-5-phosphate reductoisomerase
MRQLEFEPPDWAKFPMLGLAYRALEAGGAAGCVLNAADEVAVAAFLDSRIPFPALARVVEGTLEETGGRRAASIREILEIDCEAREIATRMVDQLSVRVAP